jgi:cytochrome b-561
MTVRERAAALWRRLTWTWDPRSERESGDAIVRNLWLHWFPAKVARASASWNYSMWLGVASAFLFLILNVTGVLLMFFYVPSTERAYGSMKDLDYAITLGWLLRNQHRWAAHGMVAVVFFHMARVFFTAAYRGQRAWNWLVGIALLLSTLLASFTGYLLPWDQLAFWAVTVGTNIAREAPLVGEWIRYVLLGGTEIGQNALLRFYVLHVFFIPAVMWVLFAYHMWRVRRDGGLAAIEPLRRARSAAPREMPRTKSYSLWGLTRGTSATVLSSTELEERDQVFSSPNLTRRLMLVFLIVFNVTILLSIFFNAPLEEAANFAVTPNPAKAPWYFLWLQELVASTTIPIGSYRISGGLIGGILVPGVLLVVAAIWPWIDRSPADAEGVWFAPSRTRQNVVFLIVALLIFVLILIGLFVRGPYWRLYWPGTPWPPTPRTL